MIGFSSFALAVTAPSASLVAFLDALVERLKDTLHENGADVSFVRKSDFKYVLSSVEDAAAGGGKASAERVVGGSKNYFKSFGAAHARTR